ncbi:4'-phosphopantetheinyl transferase family protein [Sporomusa ovata]|nr:4'-phosphopantetheinyl transferase superfamily protein [Sporomusa ovata]
MSKSLSIPEYARLLTTLEATEQLRIKKFVRYEDALRTLLAKILVRTTICRRLCVPNAELCFEKTQYGKPLLKHFKNTHFNSSHSGSWIVCAIDHAPVGVDVEWVKPIDLDIAESFFASDEYAVLMSKLPSERLNFFYSLWTLKESYVKADGRGLLLPLDSFTINVYDHAIIVHNRNAAAQCYFKQYPIDQEYQMSVCSITGAFPDQIAIYNMHSLLNEYRTYL